MPRPLPWSCLASWIIHSLVQRQSFRCHAQRQLRLNLHYLSRNVQESSAQVDGIVFLVDAADRTRFQARWMKALSFSTMALSLSLTLSLSLLYQEANEELNGLLNEQASGKGCGDFLFLVPCGGSSSTSCGLSTARDQGIGQRSLRRARDFARFKRYFQCH